MRKGIVFWISLFVLTMNTYGQTVYSPIISNGLIPDEFILKPSNRLDGIVSDIEQVNDKSIKKASKEFFIKEDYLIDYYYRSGRISFNNPLYSYINKIVDQLLIDDVELRKKVRFYIVNNTEFNASTTLNGTIFINIGLLAKIENEAQLAFVLAHEISHYTHHHILETFIEKTKYSKEKDLFKNLNYDLKLLHMTQYSRENELTADRGAVEDYISKSGYNSQAAYDLCNYLLHSDQSLGENHSVYKLFETDNFKIDDKLILKELVQNSLSEAYNDSISTHPNTQKRKENLDSILSVLPQVDKTFFVISQTEFDVVQKAARYELTHLYLQQQLFEEAICNSNFIMQTYNDKEFAETTIGIALQQLAQYKSHDDFYLIHKSYKMIQGSSQSVYYLTENMNNEEIAVTALNYNWRMKQKYPHNNVLNSTVERCFSVLVEKLGLTTDDFNKSYNSKSTFIQNAFVGNFQEEEFCKLFDKHQAIKKKIQDEKMELVRNSAKRKAIAQKNQAIRKKGFALGIDSIVIVNPLSTNYNNWKKENFQFVKSDDSRFILIDGILSCAKKLNLNVDILDLKRMERDDVERYNDYCKLSNWFSEKCNHPSANYFVYNSIYTDQLIPKCKTKYVAWINFYVKKDFKVVNNETNLIDFFLFNIETGEMLLSQRKWINGNATKRKINASIEEILKQVKNN